MDILNSYAVSLYTDVPSSCNVFFICFFTTSLRDNANVALINVYRSTWVGRSRIFNALFLLKYLIVRFFITVL